MPALESKLAPTDLPGLVSVGAQVQVRPREAWVAVHCNGLTIEVQPLLHFESRSPDRCWTNLAPAVDRGSPVLQLLESHFDQDSVQLRYRDLADHVLRVSLPSESAQDPPIVTIEGHSHVAAPVYSHLNSFVVLTIMGHQDLAILFSPCPDDPVTIEPFDYPVGRPARLAYIDSSSGFHVVEATSGEKGPFRELSRGMLRDDGSITMTLVDAGQPVCRIVLDDWAKQAGHILSPTAGWGLPVNAIEFSRTGEANQSAVVIYATLAGTSVGRGWDSVGHRAGTYRNRIRIGRTALNGPL
jgi:hypothetical protein